MNDKLFMIYDRSFIWFVKYFILCIYHNCHNNYTFSNSDGCQQSENMFVDS